MTKTIRMTTGAILMGAITATPAPAQDCDRSAQPAKPAIIELVRYRLAEGVTDDAHLKAAAAVLPFLCAQPGFVRRVLSKGESGVWIDYIEWETKELAGAAAERAQGEPAFSPFLQSIKPEAMDFSYLDIRLRMD